MLLEIEQKMYSVQEAVYKGKLSTEHEDKVLKNQEASNKINKILLSFWKYLISKRVCPAALLPNS